jgi:hypothetical protein
VKSRGAGGLSGQASASRAHGRARSVARLTFASSHAWNGASAFRHARRRRRRSCRRPDLNRLTTASQPGSGDRRL